MACWAKENSAWPEITIPPERGVPQGGFRVPGGGRSGPLGAVGGDYMGQAPPDFGLIVNDIYEHGNTILSIAVWCGALERYTVVTPPALGGGCGR